jgi:SAM-dependent methyltransferase
MLLERPLARRVYDDWYRRLLADADSVDARGMVVELGSGGGYLKSIRGSVITSDLEDGIADLTIDGRSLPFDDGSVKALLLVHTFHHIPDVREFLDEAERVLAPGGVISMVEVAHTPFAKLFFKNLHHEPYTDLPAEWAFQQKDAMMDCNQALSWMVFFRDKEKFEKRFPSLRLESAKLLPWLTYLVSGGVTAPYLVPNFAAKALIRLEGWLNPLNPAMSLHWHLCVRKQITK